MISSALGREDRVAIECCALGFWLARELIAKVGCDVLVLNAGQLAIIYKSTRKTDLNDAEKLAWISSSGYCERSCLLCRCRAPRKRSDGRWPADSIRRRGFGPSW
jgi:hypothetical protein